MVAMMVSPDWLNRYRQGQRGRVWLELRQFGARVREPELVEEAQLVCDEMALRARQNIEAIVERLTSDGFRFHANDDEETPRAPHVAPTAQAADHAAWLQERFGVPMTLLSWVRLVGDVWLVGTHPHWPMSASADPLVIQTEGSHYPGHSMQNYFDDEWTSWQESRDEHPDTEPFVLPLAPDRLHKENVSGGGPYGMILPDGCADGLFVGETTMPFVDYLNWVFRGAGFPWPTSDHHGQWRVTYKFGRDLLPL
jgi:hypothetical protein